MVTSENLVILDRDGTINVDSDQYVKSADEWTPLPDALPAMARLYQAGYKIVVATNQSGVGRGLFTQEALDAMHEKMVRMLAVDGGRIEGVFYCPHAPDEECHCRKPLPGLFEEIAQMYQISLKGVPAVGDSLRDLQAAESAGATPILVLTGKGKKTLAAGGLPAGTEVFNDLSDFVDDFLQKGLLLNVNGKHNC